MQYTVQLSYRLWMRYKKIYHCVHFAVIYLISHLHSKQTNVIDKICFILY